MNTAFLDALNLAWKIHAVEAGFAQRKLLETYEPERKEVAETLLSFDNKYAKLFSQRPPAAADVEAATTTSTTPDELGGGGENAFVKTFKESCSFTSGYGVFYRANAVNWSPTHPAQSRAFLPPTPRLAPGRLLPNATVTRVTDANVVHLEQEVPLNGSFRLFIFAGTGTDRSLADLASGMARKSSFYSSFARPDADAVSHHEKHNPHSRFFTVCTVFAKARAAVEVARDVPALLARYLDHVYADDVWDRQVPEAKASAHAKMGLDGERGGVVVVRPDGYVGAVVRLEEGGGTVEALNEYFGSFVTRRLGGEGGKL